MELGGGSGVNELKGQDDEPNIDSRLDGGHTARQMANQSLSRNYTIGLGTVKINSLV